MYYRIRAAWWKLRPPPILSPFLHSPEFAHQLKGNLYTYVCPAHNPVEFGCLYGWTTKILADAIPSHRTLRTYDLFTRASITQVQDNLGEVAKRVKFEKLNIWHWLDGHIDLPPFDFMYVDVNNTELTFREVWRRAHKEIKDGVPILIEGATRMRLNIPHRVLIKEHPGLGLLLP